MANPTRLTRALRRTALHAAPTMLAIVVLNFLLLRLAPGDAADVIAGESGFATPETMALLRRSLGLDLPILQQLPHLASSPRRMRAAKPAAARTPE
jgi:peptide/nickel transport system permease protein